MTSFATTVPVAEALWTASEEFTGEMMQWRAVQGNRLQKLVIDLMIPSLNLTSTLSEEELSACASNHASKVNQFLRSKGFSLELPDLGSVNMLYAAAVLKLLGCWHVPGENGYKLREIGKPGFRLSSDSGLRHFTALGQTVVVVPTTGGFSFLVTRPTGVTGFEMLTDWEKIVRALTPSAGNGLILPMAAIDETKVDVDDLKGMGTSDHKWVIQEALMAAKFGLTPIQVKFEAAFAYSAKRMAHEVEQPEQGDYIADHPLYFALVKRGHYLPLAAGLVDVADLSDDKELM